VQGGGTCQPENAAACYGWLPHCAASYLTGCFLLVTNFSLIVLFAGTGATVRVLHAKLAIDLATMPILNPTSTGSQVPARPPAWGPACLPICLPIRHCTSLLHSTCMGQRQFFHLTAHSSAPACDVQEDMLALALWHTPRGKWWPVEVRRAWTF
jgi:hypothetical protein